MRVLGHNMDKDILHHIKTVSTTRSEIRNKNIVAKGHEEIAVTSSLAIAQ